MKGRRSIPKPRGSWELRTNKPAFDLDAGKFAVRELVAKRIIETARGGERDLTKLAAYGIEGLAGTRGTSDTG